MTKKSALPGKYGRHRPDRRIELKIVSGGPIPLSGLSVHHFISKIPTELANVV